MIDYDIALVVLFIQLRLNGLLMLGYIPITYQLLLNQYRSFPYGIIHVRFLL
jgi:hypothetical protein